ncbi:MAG: response regulator [Desulfococcaceae bacterium]
MSNKTEILIVDDRTENLLSMEALLDSPELSIICARTGNDALGLTLDHDFALILLDVQMPDMDGFETAELLRVRQKTRHIPIIFVTAISKEPQHVFRGYEKGAVDYLFKPIRPEILISKVRIFTELYRQRRALEQSTEQLQEMVSMLRISEQKLRESEEKYRMLVENANDVIVILQDGFIRFHNRRAEDLTGYSAEELARIPFAEHIHPDDREIVMERHRQRIEGHSPGLYMFRCRNRKGEEIWTEVDAVRIAWDGNPAILAILRDVTLQHKLEEKMQQTQKMEAIGTLAGGIAHDFNNILGVIMGYTELSLRDIGNTETVKRNLGQVLKASERARELVGQILTFSHRSEQEFKPVNLNPIARETLKLLRASLPRTIEIRQRIHAENLTIFSTPIQIHQILMNLCTNAAHAMEEKGGILEISAEPFNISSDTQWQEHSLVPGDYVRITVSDTGCGIDKSIINKIFDPFFTTKGMGRGTGMGLAVVHGIVKSLKGAVHVDSQPGKGSTFEVFLPRILYKAASEKKGNIHLFTGNGRILFVDDEELLIEVGKQMLERLGYEVECCNDPVNALKIFRKDPAKYDLILSDMTMPRMTGDMLAREMLKIRPDIPIILCTGYSEHMSEEKAKDIGIKTMLLKPLDISRLALVIHQVMKAEQVSGLCGT